MNSYRWVVGCFDYVFEESASYGFVGLCCVKVVRVFVWSGEDRVSWISFELYRWLGYDFFVVVIKILFIIYRM